MICNICKKPLKKDEVSMGMGTESGPKYFCYECKPVPEDENDSGEYGMGGDWWKDNEDV